MTTLSVDMDLIDRQMALAQKLRARGLPAITAMIVAGDILSAERATEAVSKGTPAEHAYIMVGSYARWDWCVTMVAEGRLTEQWFQDHIMDLWRSSDPDDENPDYLAIWKVASNRAGGLLRDGRALPRAGHDGRIRVYRGGSPFTVKKGFAWTTDPKVARKFADGAGTRTRMVNGVVVVGYVKPRHILAYLTERGESEVIVDPATIANIHPAGGRD